MLDDIEKDVGPPPLEHVETRSKEEEMSTITDIVKYNHYPYCIVCKGSNQTNDKKPRVWKGILCPNKVEHAICAECLTSDIQFQMGFGVTKIRCPGRPICDLSFTIEDIKPLGIVSEAVLAAFEEAAKTPPGIKREDEGKTSELPSKPVFLSAMIHPHPQRTQEVSKYTPQEIIGKIKPWENPRAVNLGFQRHKPHIKSIQPIFVELPPPPVFATCWDLSSVHPNQVSTYHRLGKHRTEFPRNKLFDVLPCLQDLFCMNSLTVTYQNGSKEETLSAKCKSMEGGVEFVVNIWEMGQSPNLMAEVQKVAGDTVIFDQHQYAHSVIETIRKAVKEGVVAKLPGQLYDPLAFSQQAYVQQQQEVKTCTQACMVPSPTDDDTEGAVKIIEDFLKSPLYDHVMLAFESLLTMTDQNKSGYEAAKQFARKTVLDDSRVISEVILGLSLSGQWPPSETLENGSLRFDEESTKNHVFMALTILAQSVNLLDDIELRELSKDTKDKGFSLVMPMVVSMEKASTAPHAAYLATHILSRLCHVEPEIRSQIHEYLPVVRYAKEVGSCGHAALGLASDRLLDVLTKGDSDKKMKTHLLTS